MKPGDTVVYFAYGHHEFVKIVDGPLIPDHLWVQRKQWDSKICGQAARPNKVCVPVRTLREFSQGHQA